MKNSGGVSYELGQNMSLPIASREAELEYGGVYLYWPCGRRRLACCPTMTRYGDWVVAVAPFGYRYRAVNEELKRSVDLACSTHDQAADQTKWIADVERVMGELDPIEE